MKNIIPKWRNIVFFVYLYKQANCNNRNNLKNRTAMKELFILTLASVFAAIMLAGCSKDDTSSLVVEYPYEKYGGKTISIIPYTGDDQTYFEPIYETRLNENKSSMAIELNAGDYILRGSDIVETGFQIRSGKQTRAVIISNGNVVIKY